MQNLIPVINRVQEVFARVHVPVMLDLPVIAVVGAQSTGKSSVLESIVGKDFLPRGSGIVTRRPLILQLQHISDGEDDAVFAHKPGKRFPQLEGVTAEIEADTDRVAGRNKGISPEPILLKVFSKEVLDLTLVDLPGLTKVPLPDQPHNIEQQVRDIVLDVIKNQNCLILAVSAANTDLANSDSLKLAREIDPKGDRTIGVITKLDIMDRGTDAVDILEGKIYPLKLGYVGVVCRSQQDIVGQKSMADALAAEAEFFARNPTYAKLKERCGITYLSKRLNKLLMAHILHCIPNLKNNVNALLQGRRAEQKTYGIDLLSENKDNLGSLLLYMISKFVTHYQATIDGSFVQDITKELKGGARINYIFHVVFARAIKSIKALDGLSDDDIRTATMNAKSLHPSLFIPEAAFENLIRKQIQKLLNPSLECMTLVHEELRRILHHPDIPELLRFQKLMHQLSEIMGEVLHRYLGPTEEMIYNLISYENAFINVNHPDVLTGTSAILSMLQLDSKGNAREAEKLRKGIKKREEEALLLQEERKKLEAQKPLEERKDNGGGFFSSLFGYGKSTKEEAKAVVPASAKPSPELQRVQEQLAELNIREARNLSLEALPDVMRATDIPSSREILETEIIKQLLRSYFKVVKKNVIDLVPKAVMAFLVNKSKACAQNELVGALYSHAKLEALMEENPQVLEKRKECKQMIGVLEESLAALNEINDIEL